ncbi:MAG: hypothetical protein U0359_00060 [Byssovorax sp.]
MNPKTLGKIDNHKQQPWKLPLPAFIEELYQKRFGRRRPEIVKTIAGKVVSKRPEDHHDVVPESIENTEADGADPSSWEEAYASSSTFKLYWCETDDHDEDWFVVARTDDDARAFHERMEGYGDDEAWATLVCVLPDAEQEAAAVRGEHWPPEETLLACGAEIFTSAPQDGKNDLRAEMGSYGRVVKIRGRVYGEGDIIGNVMRELGKTTVS